MNTKTVERLIELRKEHHLSQEELAAQLGVSRQTISKWERGEASPDTDNLIALAKLYQISLDELLGHQVEKEVETLETEEEKEEEPKKDKVHIGLSGIHVDSKEGDHVHVDWHGVHIADHEGTKVDISKKGIYVDDKEKKWDKGQKIISLITGIYTILIFIGYILVGCLYNLWHPAWLCVLTIPIFSSLLDAIYKKKYENFVYPILVVFIYLLFGFLYNMGKLSIASWWHPFWFLFLTIPLYYMIGDCIKKLRS